MRKLLCTLPMVFAAYGLAVPDAAAVDPNPLQNAYWRFEEGPSGTNVPTSPDQVLDSANLNDLTAPSAASAPLYTSTVAPLALRSALPNTLALDFSPHAGGGDDLVTFATSPQNSSNDKIRNGIVGPAGFTLEAAFRPDVVGPLYQGIVSKEGKPPQGPEGTLALKVRGDTGKLQIELIDNSGARRDVQSTVPLTAGQWYAAAAVNDGSTLSLYLNSGSGYELQGTTPVLGALYEGGAANSWDRNWAIGRATYNDAPADWFDGIIDEVRLSNSALHPSQFLFVPEPGAIGLAVLALLGSVGFSIRRRRQT